MIMTDEMVDYLVEMFYKHQAAYENLHKDMPSPKYNKDDTVSFEVNGVIKTGKIYIVDRYGTFEQNEEPSYDVMVESENMLYKHVRESWIIKE